MRGLAAALWAESLKSRRSRVPWLAALGFSLAPLMGGLFMVALQDPERARRMGLITAKAQLTAGVADWPAYLGLLAQATAVGGSMLFSLVTAWVFGREWTDRSVKNLLAIPTPRGGVVLAKFAVVAAWAALLTAMVVVEGVAIGVALGLPGGSGALLARAVSEIAMSAALTVALMPPVALLAGVGAGYLAPMGWAILMVFLAQVTAATGWGGWFPWAVPALFSGLAGPRSAQLGAHSYLLVAAVGAAGAAATLIWWRRADHTR